jgi:ribosomal protein S27AE
MATKNVACPNCGREALITVNSREDVIATISTSRSPAGYGPRTKFESACPNCEAQFYYWLE